MPIDRFALAHAPSAPQNRGAASRAWRCVACGVFHGALVRSRPRVCSACHSAAIYAVPALGRVG